MPKFQYDTEKTPEESFGVPCGSYVARFVGDEEIPPFEGPSRFKQTGPPEPRLAWLFEVVEPAEHRGQRFRQISGNRPTGPKSNYVKVLKGLMGRLPTKGENIDTDDYRGRLYRVEVEENPQSDSGNYHIAYLAPHSGPAPTPAAPPPAAIPGYENRPTPPPPPPPPAEPLYWVSAGGKMDPTPQPAGKLRADYQHDPAALGRWQVCPVGSSVWAPLAASKIVEGLAAQAPPAPPFPG